MSIKRDRYVTGQGTLWIKGKKAEPFKILFDKIAIELGGVKKAKEYIPLSGKSYDLVNNLEVTQGTGRRIINAYNKLFKINK
jgi:hypothetical protein